MAILQEATSSSARLDGGNGVGWQYRLGRLVLLPLGFALAVLLAWELLCRTSRVSPVLLPPPSAVWSVLSGNSEILLQQSVPTTLEPIASFAAATLLGVALGLVSAKPEVLQLCRSLTATEWQIFRLARFPYAMPFVFAGMKVGVTMAMIGVIVGEFITAQAGLGYIIMFASSAGETATVLAAIVLLCAIGLVLFGLVALGEMAVRRWYGDEMPVGGVI
jgi:ABC-type nitrate/sulfonate/bicarbonate transport system permease component